MKTNMQMGSSFQGRIDNISLGYSECLLPLFEAVSNSIHSVHSRDQKNRLIEITILRNEVLKSTSQGQREPVIGFDITDNGIGFTEKNLTSFLTTDSPHKRKIGGKGIGRLYWLKVFDYAEVYSSFKENNEWKSLAFKFSYDHGVTPLPDPALRETNQTTVKLCSFKKNYAKRCPRDPEKIAEKILFHFLALFAGKDFSQILIVDKATSTQINLATFLDKSMNIQEQKVHFSIANQQFQLTNYHIYNSSNPTKPSLSYCGSGRVVESTNIPVPNISKRIEDNEGKHFSYLGYVTSPFLDSHIRGDRLAFTIKENREKTEEEMFPEDVTLQDIREQATDYAQRHLDTYLSPTRERHRERILAYIRTQAPQYRFLINNIDELTKEINFKAEDRDIEVALFRQKQKYAIEQKSKTSELDRRLNEKTDIDINTIKDRYREIVRMSGDLGRSDLAEHVIHRKSILSMFDRIRSLNSQGRFSLESAIHELIFPMSEDSNSVPFENSNLWIIDERLSYHAFLTSDKYVAKKKPSLSPKRPDIAVFNEAFAFHDEPEFVNGSQLSSIVLIELKAPGRDDYQYGKKTKDPIMQIQDTIDQIKNGKLVTFKGSPIDNIKEKRTPFYVYIIADITPSLSSIIKRHSWLKQSPSLDSYFGFTENYHAYCEIIPFSKLFSDAQKRNKIFFDKLGIL